MDEIFTIGHSVYSFEYFLELLRKHSIEAVCDVRSQPYSRLYPHFTKAVISEALNKNKIRYVFLGKELGVRSSKAELYRNGKIQYNLLAKCAEFQAGIGRILQGIKSYKIALMCAEKDPIMCHRAILICREIKKKDVNKIYHILESGELETHFQLESRLLKLYKFDYDDLFMSEKEKLEKAYDLQSDKIAYIINEDPDEKK